MPDLPLQPEVKASISLFMAYVHTTVNEMSKVYLATERRYNYTTPKTFLEQIKLYQNLLARKRMELVAKIERLENGLMKLQSTASQVGSHVGAAGWGWAPPGGRFCSQMYPPDPGLGQCPQARMVTAAERPPSGTNWQEGGQHPPRHLRFPCTSSGRARPGASACLPPRACFVPGSRLPLTVAQLVQNSLAPCRHFLIRPPRLSTPRATGMYLILVTPCTQSVLKKCLP